MKKSLFVFLMFSLHAFAQIGIGTTTPDASALLDVTATNKGVLIPRVSLTNVSNTTTPINAPATGLLVWNTNSATVGGSGTGFYYFNGTVWTAMTVLKNTLDQGYDQGGAGAGRTINADANAVRINGTDGLLVTGTFGSGATTELSGAGTRMFFNPKKAAFRSGNVSGTQWDDVNIGTYSTAFGLDTKATGNRSFAANFDTMASGEDASAFGKSSIASGIASASFGNGSTASGNNAFAGGTTSLAGGTNALAFGNLVEAPSFSEVAFGQFNTTYVPVSSSAFNSADRIFSIGIGTGITTRKNAFEIFKDGRVKINEAYVLPTTDGTAGQVMTTNGAGTVAWSTLAPITPVSFYAADVATTVNAAAWTLIPGCSTACIPTLINPTNAKVQIKLVIRYTAAVGSNDFRIRANDNTGVVTILNTTTGDVLTNTVTGTGGVLESAWKNWNPNMSPYELNLEQQRVGAGDSITIANVYLLVKTQ